MRRRQGEPPFSVPIAFSLTQAEACAIAQFCKRARFDTCRALASDDTEAWLMADAIEALKRALAHEGYNPR